MILLPKDLDHISPPVVWRRADFGYQASFEIRHLDPTGRHLPILKATADAPSLYPHAPKRVA